MATNKSRTSRVLEVPESRLTAESLKLPDGTVILQVSFRPNSSRNAFGEAEAHRLLGLLKQKSIGGLLWTGNGTLTFCSGGDLAAYAQMKNLKTSGTRANRLITKALEALAAANFPTVAAVDGDCWGGGIEFISAFDFVVTCPHALFGLWQSRMALTPGWGGYSRLARRVTESKLKSSLMRQNPMIAAEALKLGLVDEIVPVHHLQTIAQSRLQRMMGVESKAQRAIRLLGTVNERKLFESLWAAPEHLKKLGSKF